MVDVLYEPGLQRGRYRDLYGDCQVQLLQRLEGLVYYNEQAKPYLVKMGSCTDGILEEIITSVLCCDLHVRLPTHQKADEKRRHLPFSLCELLPVPIFRIWWWPRTGCTPVLQSRWLQTNHHRGHQSASTPSIPGTLGPPGSLSSLNPRYRGTTSQPLLPQSQVQG